MSRKYFYCKKRGIISPLLPEALSGSRPGEVSLRKIINAIFYITRGGYTWQLFSHDQG
jgi:transposase